MRSLPCGSSAVAAAADAGAVVRTGRSPGQPIPRRSGRGGGARVVAMCALRVELVAAID